MKSDEEHCNNASTAGPHLNDISCAAVAAEKQIHIALLVGAPPDIVEQSAHRGRGRCVLYRRRPKSGKD